MLLDVARADKAMVESTTVTELNIIKGDDDTSSPSMRVPIAPMIRTARWLSILIEARGLRIRDSITLRGRPM